MSTDVPSKDPINYFDWLKFYTQDKKNYIQYKKLKTSRPAYKYQLSSQSVNYVLSVHTTRRERVVLRGL